MKLSYPFFNPLRWLCSCSVLGRLLSCENLSAVVSYFRVETTFADATVNSSNRETGVSWKSVGSKSSQFTSHRLKKLVLWFQDRASLSNNSLSTFDALLNVEKSIVNLERMTQTSASFVWTFGKGAACNKEVKQSSTTKIRAATARR